MAFSRPDQSRRARRADTHRGQPRGLIFLTATQLWERFAFFGTQALLLLFMARYLLLPEHAQHVIGLGALRAALEGTSGPISAESLAAQIYGLYIALASLAPILGGIIADRILGQHRMVVIGAALTAIGNFLLAFDLVFLLALAILVIAGGAFRPSIAAQVGALYGPGDARRDRGYAIFYLGIAMAALLAPPLCGTLAEDWGWPYGFAAAGLAMAAGLAVYLFAGTSLPCDASDKLASAPRKPGRAGVPRWHAIVLLVGILFAAALMWAAYEQKSSTIALWGDDHIDRTLDLLLWHGQIPLAAFQAFNPILIVVFTPLMVTLWAWQGRRGREPPSIVKMALGALCVALAYVIMAGAVVAAQGDESSWWWLAGYLALISIGELQVAPIGLSLISKVAAARVLSTMMGLWLAVSFAGRLIAGSLAGFWSEMDKASYFLLVAGIAALAGGLMLACAWLSGSLPWRPVTQAPPPDPR